MNRKTAILLAIPLLLMLIFAVHFFLQQPEEPLLQAEGTLAPFIPIDDFEQFTHQFNADSGHIRVISLLSPSCPVCLRGFAGMKTIMENIADANIRNYVIWLPMLEADDEAMARQRAAKFYDPRISYFWDNGRLSAGIWQEVFELNEPAWDLYFFYPPETTWESKPGQPEFLMRQLKGLTSVPFWNVQQFQDSLETALE